VRGERDLVRVSLEFLSPSSLLTRYAPALKARPEPCALLLTPITTLRRTAPHHQQSDT
jgi:hypothetical protein